MANEFKYIKDECKVCGGKGYIWHENRQRKDLVTGEMVNDEKFGHDPEECDCLKKMMLYMKLKEANVPAEYYGLTLKDYRPKGDVDSEAKMLFPYMEDFGRFSRQKVNLLLYGTNGTGKTMLSIELMKAAMRKKLSAYYEFYPVILDSFLRKGYEADKGKDRLDSIFANVDVLVLDELGKEAAGGTNTDVNSNILEMHILKKRVHKITILISNQSPDSLKKIYNDTISSLLSKNYKKVMILGSDYRGVK